MTWVIAAPSAVGYAFGISDIQVTYELDGRKEYKDCLQKVYRVSRSLALGFAGSVSAGFAMRDLLADRLNPLPEGNDWVPQWVVDRFAPEARELFSHASHGEQRDGCELVLFGVHPNQGIGIGNRTAPYVYRMVGPAFEPEHITRGATSIGSGGGVEAYRAKLDELVSEDNLFANIKAETLGNYGSADSIMLSLTRMMRENPVKGVSLNLHLVVISQGEVLIGTNDHDTHGRTIERLRMPRVATSYAELREMIGAASAESAVCRGVSGV